jgi:hypothetical protein
LHPSIKPSRFRQCIGVTDLEDGFKKMEGFGVDLASLAVYLQQLKQ